MRQGLNKRVKFARADRLELYSTTLPADTNLCRDFTLAHALSADEHKHSPARMHYSKFCTLHAELQKYAALMLWFDDCQNSTALRLHLYTVVPDPRFWFSDSKILSVRPTLMHTKNLYENGPNPFFFSGPKT